VCGAGNVGAACAAAMTARSLGNVFLQDVVEDLAIGKAMDINQASPYNRLQASVLHPWPLTTNERTESAPVFDDKCMFIRGERFLYCISGQ
jgi:malate/lactate dehydrogenase